MWSYDNYINYDRQQNLSFGVNTTKFWCVLA